MLVWSILRIWRHRALGKVEPLLGIIGLGGELVLRKSKTCLDKQGKVTCRMP